MYVAMVGIAGRYHKKYHPSRCITLKDS